MYVLRNMVILEHFGDKEKLIVVHQTIQSRNLETNVDRQARLVVDQ